jgi:HK97 family phage major capsid protein
MVMNELIAAHAESLNDAAINGSGESPEPLGILNMDGIGQVVGGESGSKLSWPNLVALETEVAANNADLGTMAYVTNARVRGAMKTTEKASGQAVYLMDGNFANGYKTVISNLVPKNLAKGGASNLSAMIFGNFADLLVGWWGGIDLRVDPYTQAETDQVRVFARAFHDISVRRKESFAVIKDIIA